MSSPSPQSKLAGIGYERFFDLSPDLLTVVGFDGYLKRVNPAWEKLLGWTAEELLARPYPEFIHHEDRERTLAEAARLAEPGTETRDFELRFARRGGGWAWLLFSAQGDPETQLIYALGKDISVRKQAEHDLREWEERFRLLVDGTPDYGIFMLDPEGHIVSWNLGAQRIKGYSAEEIIGEHFSRFYTEEDVQSGHPADELRQAAAEGQYREEGWRLRKDGTRFWADVRITALRDSDGTLRGFGKVTRDATDRRRNDSYMAAQVAVAEALTEGGPIEESMPRVLASVGSALDWQAGAFWSTDADSDDLCCRAFWAADPGAAREFEQETRELRLIRGAGLPGRVLAAADALLITDVAEDSGYLRAETARRAGLVGAVGVPVLSAGGEVVGVLEFLSAEPLEADEDLMTKLQTIAGEVGQVVRRRQAEDALAMTAAELRRRADELERSNAELEEFAYVASHDLSEPLRMVSGFVQLLGERYKGRLDDDADEFIGYAVEGVRRMQELIDDLLALSRVGRSVEDGDVDLNAVLEVTLATLRPMIEESRARVEVGQLPVVLGDARELGQLMQNLLTNAMKFVEEGPPRVEVSAQRLNGMWELSVRDNGIGIEPRHAERIFKMFQRLHVRDSYPGTGIGLAICKKIAERNGGTIRVDPADGGGSVFRVTLPAAQEAE